MKRAARGFTLIEIMVAMLLLGIMTAIGYAAYRAARTSAERTEESLQRSKEIEFGMRVIAQDLAQAAPRPVRSILSAEEPDQPAFYGTPGAGTVTPDKSGTGFSSSTISSGDLLASSKSNFGAGSNSSMSFGGDSGDASITPILTLTRLGWSNTAGAQRGTLQRVSYALVNDTLKRAYQINTDAVQGTKPVVQDLLKQVKGVQFRYLDSNQTWQGNWPTATSTSTVSVAPTAATGVTTTVNGTQPQTLQLRPIAVEVVIEFKDWGRIRRVVEVAA